MRRLAVALLVVCASIAIAPGIASGTHGADGPISDEWLDEAIPGVIDEIALLATVGLFEPHPVVDAIVDFAGVVDLDGADARLEVSLLDLENAALLEILGSEQRAWLSPAVLVALEPVPDAAAARWGRGERAFLAPGPWLDALADLLLRDGAAPRQRVLDDRMVILEVLREIEETGEVDLDRFADTDVVAPSSDLVPTSDTVPTREAVPTTSTAAPTPAGPATAPASEPTERAEGGLDTRMIAAVAVVGLATVIAGGVVIARRRRRSTPRAGATERHADAGGPAPRPGRPPFDVDEGSAPPPSAASRIGLVDVIDVSRRMTAALDEEAVRRIAVDESIRLAGAEAGAFVQTGRDGARITTASMDGLFSREPVVGGALGRAMETGQSTLLVSDDDPALVRVPVALAAVPVIVDGGVAGAIIVIRAAASPFSRAEVDAIELLAPVTGTALRAAAAHHDAVSAADVDGLTELHNRRRLDRDLDRIGDTSTVCFAMIDVDHFKAFNDAHGHLAGDIALQSVARAIEASVRDTDSVYRYGGEEFSVVLHDTDLDEAVRVLERVRASVAATPVPGIDGSPQSITISVGVTAGAGLTARELPVTADAALYAAKGAGRDCVVLA